MPQNLNNIWAQFTRNEIALWNKLKNRLSAGHYNYSDRLLLNFQLQICYGEPACLIVIVIILTPWHTDLKELIILKLSKNSSSFADSETLLPRFYSPSLARLIHSTHLQFIFL
jgi:hypothetical protein